MTTKLPQDNPSWTEEASQIFVEFARVFVPGREAQIDTIVALIGDRGVGHIWELCCGAGELAEALLERNQACTVIGFDGSALMRLKATERLKRFGERFRSVAFDLADDAWRRSDRPVSAVVSSLAVHHLDGAEKQQLFHDLYQVLAPGGRLVIADLVEPAGTVATAAAADAWNEEVRRRSLRLTGSTAAYEEFREQQWNIFLYPDPMDKPSSLYDQLRWLDRAGFEEVDVYWLHAGHAVFGGRIPEKED